MKETNQLRKLMEAVDGDNSAKGDYMLLSRLQQDCEYFLGNGGRSERVLWAGNVGDHIANMKEIWNRLIEKPEWLSMEQIEKYEKEMTQGG